MFKKFYRKFNKKARNKGNSNLDNKGSGSNTGCFQCGSKDHIKRDCPKRDDKAKEKKFKKNFMATWGEHSDSDSEENNMVICPSFDDDSWDDVCLDVYDAQDTKEQTQYAPKLDEPEECASESHGLVSHLEVESVT